jgi:site-specific DNA-methyltransferase (adenine-specific)
MIRVERIGDATLYLGDCREILPTLSGVDAVVTDPPYSSGGAFRGDRTAKPSAKYINSDSEFTSRIEFSGDNRDQRSFLTWSSLWRGQLHQMANPGSTICVFTDWRQMPTITDAVQCGGWVWRNIVTWWKPGIRMQRGRFSSSAEYVVYGSKGIPLEGERSPQNVLSFAPVSGDEKEHIAEKPVELLEAIIGVTPANATVLDPFMGSGTTGVACAKLGRRFIGIELDQHHFDIACRRIEEAQRQPDMFVTPAPKAEQLGMFGDAV